MCIAISLAFVQVFSHNLLRAERVCNVVNQYKLIPIRRFPIVDGRNRRAQYLRIACCRGTKRDDDLSTSG